MFSKKKTSDINDENFAKNNVLVFIRIDKPPTKRIIQQKLSNNVNLVDIFNLKPVKDFIHDKDINKNIKDLSLLDNYIVKVIETCVSNKNDSAPNLKNAYFPSTKDKGFVLWNKSVSLKQLLFDNFYVYSKSGDDEKINKEESACVYMYIKFKDNNNNYNSNDNYQNNIDNIAIIEEKTKKKKRITLHDEILALMENYPKGIGSEILAILIDHERKNKNDSRHVNLFSSNESEWRNWRAQIRHAVNPNQRLNNDTFLVCPGSHYYVLTKFVVTDKNIENIVEGLKQRKNNKLSKEEEIMVKSRLKKVMIYNMINDFFSKQAFTLRQLRKVGITKEQFSSLMNMIKESFQEENKEYATNVIHEWIEKYIRKIPIASKRQPIEPIHFNI